MVEKCDTCEDIVSFERSLDERAEDLTARVNELCAPVRARNKERWESFANIARIPVIGDLYYELFRTPKGLEEEPQYYHEAWYIKEGKAIERDAHRLETMKRNDLEHWGDELVIPGLSFDPAGYYTPNHKIKRKEVYDPQFTRETKKQCIESELQEEYAQKEGFVEQLDSHIQQEIAVIDKSPDETYFVHIPDKYDFSSAAGSEKMHEGDYVMDSTSKEVVLRSRCNFRAKNLWLNHRGIKNKLIAYFARSGVSYTLS